MSESWRSGVGKDNTYLIPLMYHYISVSVCLSLYLPTYLPIYLSVISIELYEEIEGKAPEDAKSM